MTDSTNDEAAEAFIKRFYPDMWKRAQAMKKLEEERTRSYIA